MGAEAVGGMAISQLHTVGAAWRDYRNMAVRRWVPGSASRKSAGGFEDPA